VSGEGVDPEAARRVADEARRVLATNRRQGVSDWNGMRYDFVCPSPTHYPFQWFWDSSFHAIALLQVDAGLAKQELRCLMQGAQPDGYIAHMLLWDTSSNPEWFTPEACIRLDHPHFTGTIQPPVVARSLERIYDATHDAAFVRELFPRIVAFMRWLDRVRDVDRDGLVTIIQPDESGLDASPKYDREMQVRSQPPSDTLPDWRRGMHRLFDVYAKKTHEQQAKLDVFSFEDVMMNTIYADAWRALARLARAIGLEGADEYEQRYRRTLDTLMAKCWDDRRGLFWDLSGAREDQVRVLTFTSLFPLVLPDLDRAVAARLVNEHLLNEQEFWLTYPIPSVAASEPSFDPGWLTKTTWRGPTWLNVNWYLYWGLRQHGFRDVARELARRTVEMQAKGGIREFYDPLTAAGQGATSFGWSTLVLDLIAAER